MELQGHEKVSDRQTPTLSRKKTPLRQTYETEVLAFKNRYGSIEDVRLSLGFSRRKMCQALMVDPSAWTRWRRDESKIPPHIYRALEWFLLLKDKNPELVRALSLGFTRHPGHQALQDRIDYLEAEISTIKGTKTAQNSKFMLLVFLAFVIGLVALMMW